MMASYGNQGNLFTKQDKQPFQKKAMGSVMKPRKNSPLSDRDKFR